jgi:hypothetical protein
MYITFIAQTKGSFPAAPQTPFYDPLLYIYSLFDAFSQTTLWMSPAVSAQMSTHAIKAQNANCVSASARCKYKKRVACLNLCPYRRRSLMQTPFANNLAHASCDNKYTQRAACVLINARHALFCIALRAKKERYSPHS